MTSNDERDFDCCGYRSKSGKTTCGALRYYHDRVSKRHKFVEPKRELTPLKQAQERIKSCPWSYDEYWSSPCGVEFVFDNDGPTENKFKFCYGCGKPIEIVRDKGENDE